MKILHLSTSDIRGGAARAAYRLHKGLLDIGADSSMLVQFKTTDTPDIVGHRTPLERECNNIRPHLEALPVRFYKNRPLLNFSPAILPDTIASRTAKLNPDVVHLHWIAAGFMRLETLRRLKRPLVWTLHDMWAFTGGCHYANECTRYEQFCGACPILGSTKTRDLSGRIWKRKNRAWRGLQPTIVTPSRWLADCAGASSLFHDVRIEVIPNGIDLNRYKPVNKQVARDLLSLPQEKNLILFGALDSTSTARKGFPLLAEALGILSRMSISHEIEVVIFGASAPNQQIEFGLRTHYVGQFHDELSLVLLYAAADVFVAPSIQENLANTVIESLACGTPCVAFNVGGMPDMIEHQRNGWLAQLYAPDDLAAGIAWVLENKQRWKALSLRSRRKAEEEYALEKVSRQYSGLYNEILSY